MPICVEHAFKPHDRRWAVHARSSAAQHSLNGTPPVASTCDVLRHNSHGTANIVRPAAGNAQDENAQLSYSQRVTKGPCKLRCTSRRSPRASCNAHHAMHSMQRSVGARSGGLCELSQKSSAHRLRCREPKPQASVHCANGLRESTHGHAGPSSAFRRAGSECPEEAGCAGPHLSRRRMAASHEPMWLCLLLSTLMATHDGRARA